MIFINDYLSKNILINCKVMWNMEIYLNIYNILNNNNDLYYKEIHGKKNKGFINEVSNDNEKKIKLII